MPLIEARVLLPADRVDAWSDAALAAGALAVTIEDEDRDTPAEVAMYGEPGLTPDQAAWRNNRVRVLLDTAVGIDAILAQAADALDGLRPTILEIAPVEDCDWVRHTQAQFEPIRAGNIWIVPSWHVPPDPDACNIRIDPGAAFGTGTHPTTRLCLGWMDAHPPRGLRVLDYGCGSGILSICAALLGAVEVLGIDIDPQALPTARDNALRNGVRAHYTLPEELAAHAGQGFDLVVANILTNPIMLLAPTLLHHLHPRGTILLSGILERQALAVCEAYRRADPTLGIEVAAQEEGWVALAGTRSRG